MSEQEIDEIEAELPKLAVEALNAAHQRAVASGRPVVVVEGREVVRIGPHGREVLKTLPPRLEVTVTTKQATT